MRPIAVLARPLISSMFIVGGLDAARSPGPRVAAAQKLGLPQPELAVRLNGAAMVLGGAAFAVGYKPRRAALVLAGTLAPTTYAGHAFWEQSDGAARKMQQIHFFKNLSMLGGLLLAIGDAPHRGAPHSARKAARQVARAAVHSARATEKAERKAGTRAQARAARIEASAQKSADKVQAKAERRAAKLQAKAESQLAEAGQLAEVS